MVFSASHRESPVNFQKTFKAHFRHMSPHLQGAWSVLKQTCQISREELTHHLKQREYELGK